MIRKIKNILHNKENSGPSPPSSAHFHNQLAYNNSNSNSNGHHPNYSSDDVFEQNHPQQQGMIFSRERKNNNDDDRDSSPVNFIKKKIRSTKSWAKIPSTSITSTNTNANNANNSNNKSNNHQHQAASSIFENDASAYESITSANHEFETYTRRNSNIGSINHNTHSITKNNTNNSSSTNPPHNTNTASNNTTSSSSTNTRHNTNTNTTSSVDYGFESAASCHNESASDSASIQRQPPPTLSTLPPPVPLLPSQQQQQQLQQQQQTDKQHTICNFICNSDGQNLPPPPQNLNPNLNPNQQSLSPTSSHSFSPTLLYRNIFERLQCGSIDRPAHIPLLCVDSFRRDNPAWSKLSARFDSAGINIRLIELERGVPVNGLFYLSDLDMVYVRTYSANGEDDLDGYVPRSTCRPVFNIESSCSTNNNNNSNNTEYEHQKDESIKYHSLTMDLEYDIIKNNQEQEASNNNQVNDYAETVDFERPLLRSPSSSCSKEDGHHQRVLGGRQLLTTMQSRSRLPISIRSSLNLGRSAIMNHHNHHQHHLLNNNQKINAAPQTARTAQEENVFNNFTYKSPMLVAAAEAASSAINNNNTNNDQQQQQQQGETGITPTTPTAPTTVRFERKKTSRRSLDSSLIDHQRGKFYSVPIDIADDLNIINENEATSKKVTQPVTQPPKCVEPTWQRGNPNGFVELNESASAAAIEGRIWTVIIKHEARSFQEVTVVPGMMAMVIKEYGEWIYVKLVGFENSSLNLAQQYGMIPRSCAIDLQEIIFKSSSNQHRNKLQQKISSHSYFNNEQNGANSHLRKSKITAL